MRAWFRAFLLAGVMLTWMGAATPVYASKTFGVVHVVKAIKDTEHYKNALKRFEKELGQRQVVLEKKKSELLDRTEKLQAKLAVSDPASLASEKEELLKERQALQMAFMQSQQELTAFEQRIAEQLRARFSEIVREVAVRGDYVYVFDAGSEVEANVLYHDKKVDLTSEVSALYKERFGKKPLDFNFRPKTGAL